MKHLSYLLLLLMFQVGYTQLQKIDSLKSVLESQTEQDLNRLNTLNKLASEYNVINPSEGLRMSGEAIKLAELLDAKMSLAKAYKSKAQNHHALSQDSRAMLMYDKSASILDDLEEWKEIGKITFNKGIIYFGQSKYEEANRCNEEAFKIFEKEQDSSLMAVVLNSMGINQMQRSLYPQALDTYLSAANIYEKRQNTKNGTYASILNNIGLLYNRLKDTVNALDYYQKSLELSKSLDYEFSVANTLTNIGSLYDYNGKSQLALDYYYKAYDIMSRLKNTYGIASALTNIGITQVNLKNYDIAIKELSNSIALFEELQNTYNLAVVHQNIGVALFENQKLGPSRYKEAKFHFNKAITYAKESNNLETLANTLEYLSEMSAAQNNYKTAYSEFKEAIKLKDSIISIEKKEEIARLEVTYEYEKKQVALEAAHEQELALNEAEIKRQKIVNNAFIIGGIGVIIASLIGFFLYRRKKEADAKSKEAEFNAKVSDTELKALRSQMNPHFIFNSLNSIGDFILKNDINTASDYLSKFAKLMRMTLENSEKKEILLEDDIVLLKTYLDIERKRFNNNFDYSIEVSDDIDAENTLVPPMILQPFLENSIIHGLANKEESGHINIYFKLVDEMLTCIVDDDGIGREKSIAVSRNLDKKSMGMSITKSRIDIINKKFKTKGGIKIVDKDKGTRVEVSLPIQLAF